MAQNLTRTGFTRQFDHVGVVAHGAHPEYRLEFDAKVADAANAAQIFQGSVVSLNADGEYVLGCGAGTAPNCPVPFISMKNVFDPDVTTGIASQDNVATKTPVITEATGAVASVTAGTREDWKTSTYSAMGGVITAIPCTAGYELETTEFDKTVTDYAVNDALFAAANVGTLTNDGVIGTNPVVGFVSKTPYGPKNFTHTRIAFFTNFIPVTA